MGGVRVTDIVYGCQSGKKKCVMFELNGGVGERKA